MQEITKAKYKVKIFKSSGYEKASYYAVALYEDKACRDLKSRHFATESAAIKAAKKYLEKC